MIECEEPDCTRRATREYHGRKICEDHYEKYKEEEDKMLIDD